MLIRISLIVAILAGLAVGVLNFVKVKEKVVTLYQERDSERSQKETALTERDDARKDLAKTSAELKITKQNLETTTTERDRAVADLSAATKQNERLTADLSKTRQERDNAQAELAAYEATGYKPEQIVAMGKQYKGLEDRLTGAQEENKLLGQNIRKLKNRLLVYENPDVAIPLPATMKGKVLVADPKWNFVVLNLGEDQGILENGELLVNRDGRLVAKVRVRSVQKDRSIANVMPGWQLGDVIEGDVVIPAHPAS